MLAATERNRVGAEFAGMARRFRAAVHDADAQAEIALAAITAPLKRRLSTAPSLRHEQVMAAERSWRLTMPVAFRCGEILVHRGREFCIGEARVSATRISNPIEWGDAAIEPGVSVILLAVSVRKNRLNVIRHPLASISAHALARRFERGASRDHASVLDDLCAFLDAGEDGERVAAGNGYWIGSIIPAIDERTKERVRLRNVRSFFDADMVEDAERGTKAANA